MRRPSARRGGVEKDSNSYTPSRKARLISAIVYGLASAVLFIFRPIPPVGLVAAIDLAWVMLCVLYLAFFPAMPSEYASELSTLSRRNRALT
jgi:hypothetical protein